MLQLPIRLVRRLGLNFHTFGGLMPLRFHALVAAALAPGLSMAAISSELHQRIGACSTVKDHSKRAMCFEGVAKAAVAALEAAPAPTPAAPASTVAPSPAPPKSQYAAFIARAKSNVTAGLKDPSSAQWRNVFVGGTTTLPMLCGEVNAKNSYGAYIGFRRFVATKEPMLTVLDDPTGKDRHVMDRWWPKHCSDPLEQVEEQTAP